MGGGNLLTIIDLKANTNLKHVKLEDNQLYSMDFRNGNNDNVIYFRANNNPNLTCIFVDDAEYSTENWTNIDPTSTFVETQEQCDAIGVNEIQLPYDDLMIYPNPVENILIVELSHLSTKKSILTVLNILGKEVYSQTNKGSKEVFINTSSLLNGVYLVKVNTEKENLTKKFIKI